MRSRPPIGRCLAPPGVVRGRSHGGPRAGALSQHAQSAGVSSAYALLPPAQGACAGPAGVARQPIGWFCMKGKTSAGPSSATRFPVPSHQTTQHRPVFSLRPRDMSRDRRAGESGRKRCHLRLSFRHASKNSANMRQRGCNGAHLSGSKTPDSARPSAARRHTSRRVRSQMRQLTEPVLYSRCPSRNRMGYALRR